MAGPSAEVIDRVGKLLDDRLSEADRDVISSGDVRWKNRGVIRTPVTN